MLVGVVAFVAFADDVTLCPDPSDRPLVVQSNWGKQKVNLNLLNWAKEPVTATVIQPGVGEQQVYQLPRQGGGADKQIKARPGSILRISNKTGVIFERMVVPHDGSMGTSSIFPCHKIKSSEFEPLRVKNLTCDEAVPTKFWNCVRTGIELSDLADGRYGFTPEEVEAVPRRLRKYGPYTTETDTDWNAPPFSEGPGYLVVKMPDDVYAAAKKVYQQRTRREEKEGDIAGHYSNFYGRDNEGNAWTMVNLDGFQRERGIISNGVRSVLTWWVGKPLQHEATYGIRVYHRNAVLLNHRDVPTTHFISAVLQVEQNAEEGWPLFVETRRDPLQYSEVYLQPGYMALYEGVRLKHGRPMRFNGTDFAMVFTHNRPIDFYPQNRYEDRNEL
jgi:hypothetical protein